MGTPVPGVQAAVLERGSDGRAVVVDGRVHTVEDPHGEGELALPAFELACGNRARGELGGEVEQHQRDQRQPRELGHAAAAQTRSGVIGSCLTRPPTTRAIALAMAPGVGTVRGRRRVGSPVPRQRPPDPVPLRPPRRGR